jgi:hypothetical protein
MPISAHNVCSLCQLSAAPLHSPQSSVLETHRLDRADVAQGAVNILSAQALVHAIQHLRMSIRAPAGISEADLH